LSVTAPERARDDGRDKEAVPVSGLILP